MELAFDPRVAALYLPEMPGRGMSPMASAAYYRREAERAREQALNSKDSEAILRWLKIAKDYRALAEAIEEDEKGSSASTPPPSQQQQQPMQQQQAKSKPKDKE